MGNRKIGRGAQNQHFDDEEYIHMDSNFTFDEKITTTS